jgi:hypothetical protein
MKLAAFDLEITRIFPEGATDWWAYAPLGISCAAVALSDSDDAIVWSGHKGLGIEGSRAVIAGLMRLVEDGYTLVGFNSLGFDWRVLETESGLDCRQLALNHIDFYFHLFCALGYGPGLDRLAKGMGLAGKPAGMDGAKAPVLWAEGKRQQVIDYCVADVCTTLEIALRAQRLGGVQWVSGSGKQVTVDFERWLTATEALDLPEPDVSWMTTPRTRKGSTEWMLNAVLP